MQALAWQLEGARDALADPELAQFVHVDPQLVALEAHLDECTRRYQELTSRLAAIFTAYYEKMWNEERESNFENLQAAVIQEADDSLASSQSIAFIFCDALRKDLASALQNRLIQRKKAHASLIQSHKTSGIQNLALLPSITNLGWNRVLTGGDALGIKLAGKTIVSGLAGGEKTQVLNSPGDRETRLAQLLSTSDRPVEIFHVDLAHYIDSLSQFREKILDADAAHRHWVVPVVWYDKIDNHEMKYED